MTLTQHDLNLNAQHSTTALRHSGEQLIVGDHSGPPRPAASAEPSTVKGSGVADPAPLGLAAFGLTTLLLSLVNAGILPKDTEPMVFGVALAFGGIAQLLAGMWEFAKGNVFGATVFTSYGAFWLSFWAFLTFYAKEIPAAHVGGAVGWYLVGWAAFTLLMFVASLRTTAVLAALFGVVIVVFGLLAAGAFAASATLTHAGGILGLVAAALAFYLCLAAVTSATFGKPIVPNRPLIRT